MPASFVGYIDESGDEGFSFQSGSSEWFVLSAVITRKHQDLEQVKIVDEVRDTIGKPPKKPLHFKDLKHRHRLPYIGRIAQTPLRVISVIIHKPSIQEQELFAERYRMYFYAVRYLVERISWLCRDYVLNDDPGDGTIDLVFSNRSGMSYEEMKQYLERLRQNTVAYDVRIEWSAINTGQIFAYTPGKRMGLQLADAVASGFRFGIERVWYGFSEDRYARMLKPVVYHYDGVYEGYGLKFWPREVRALLQEDERLDWFRRYYRK